MWQDTERRQKRAERPYRFVALSQRCTSPSCFIVCIAVSSGEQWYLATQAAFVDLSQIRPQPMIEQ